jgi:hypothetical protein
MSSGGLVAARGAQDGAAELVDFGDGLGGQFDHVVTEAGDEALEAEADAQDRGHVVVVVAGHDDGPDDVVDARAEASAGDDGALGLGRVVVEELAGTGLLHVQGEGFVRAQLVQLLLGEDEGLELFVADEAAVAQGRRNLGLAQARDGDIHRGLGRSFLGSHGVSSVCREYARTRRFRK